MVNQMYPKLLPLWCVLLKLLCACLRWFRERFYYFYYFSLWIWGFFFLLKYGIMQGHCSRNTIVGVLQERSLMLYGVLLKQALLTQGLTAPTQMAVMESHWHCRLPEMSGRESLTSITGTFGSKLMGPPLPLEGLFTNVLMSNLDDDYGAVVIEPWILNTWVIHFLWSGAYPVEMYRWCSGITGHAPRFF